MVDGESEISEMYEMEIQLQKKKVVNKIYHRFLEYQSLKRHKKSATCCQIVAK